MLFGTIDIFFRKWVLTRNQQYVSWCINDVYEAYQYCYFKHSLCWLLLNYYVISKAEANLNFLENDLNKKVAEYKVLFFFKDG